MLKKTMQFINTDLWRLKLKHYSRGRSFLINQLRILVLTFRGFMQDKCQLRASALTLYTLLSLVPVIALMFAIARGFGMEKRVEAELLSSARGQEEILQDVIDFANKLLNETRSDVIAGLGILFLLYAVIKVLSNIEHSFNDIWGIKLGRSWGRKLTDYLAIMMIAPIFLVVSSSITVLIRTQVLNMTERFAWLQGIGPLIHLALKPLPYAIIWVLFIFLYMFMPNTRVKWKAGIPAGIIAGTLFQITQWLYITFQVGAARYGAIYGGFAAVPLFVIWLQMSWLIVLFGAELSFANQNVETYEFEPDCLNLSSSFKKELSLLITHRIVKRFCEGQPPLTSEELAHELDLPVRLVRDLTWQLVQADILAQVKTNDEKLTAYLPAKDVNQLSLAVVLDSLDGLGQESLPVLDDQSRTHLQQQLDKLKEHVHNSSANLLLRDI